MAILSDRINTKQITTLGTQNYDSLSDSAVKEASKPLSLFGSDISIKSLFMGAIPTKLRSPLEDIYASFSDIVCNGIVPYDLRLGSYKDRLLRELALGVDLGIGCIGNLALLDQLMGRKPFSFFNIGYGLDFDLSKEALLNNLLSAETARLLRGMNQSNSLANCGLDSMKGFLANDLAFSGMSLKQKLAMLDMLNNINSCSGTGNNYYANKSLSTVTAAGAVNKLGSMGTTNATTSIKTLRATTGYIAGDTDAATIENRENILIGFRKSLAQLANENIELKLLMLSLFKETDNLKIKQQELINTIGVISNILKSLSDSKYKTESPVNDLNNVLTGLNNVDPNWNKNEAGLIDYSSVTTNERLVTLSKRVINITPVSDTTLDPDKLASELKTEVIISLLNTVYVTKETVTNLLITNPNTTDIMLNKSDLMLANNPEISSNLSNDIPLDILNSGLVSDPESIFNRINQTNTYENNIVSNGILNALNSNLNNNLYYVTTNTSINKKLLMDTTTSINNCYVNSIGQEVCCAKKECMM